MAQEDKAAEHGQVCHTKNLGNGRVGRRHRGQPQKAHHRREHIHTDRAEWRPDEEGDDYCTGEVNEGQDVAFGQALAQSPCRVGAKHIEQANQGQRVTGHLGRQAVVFEVAGHVHADKHHLKTADEVARHQQLKAAVLKRFTQRMKNRLLAGCARLVARQVRLAQSPGQGRDEQSRHAQDAQSALPAQGPNQLPLNRHH